MRWTLCGGEGEMVVTGCNMALTVCRLRDLSAQDKLDHQRVMKDLEKNAAEFNQVKEQKDKIFQELQVSEK